MASNRPKGVFSRLLHDPNWRIVNLPDGDVQAYYKGKKVDYDKDHIDSLEERAHRISQGKDPSPITSFRR